MKRVGFMTRLTPENHKWLDSKAKGEDRSMTYILDRIITQARETEQTKENAPEGEISEALVTVTP